MSGAPGGFRHDDHVAFHRTLSRSYYIAIWAAVFGMFALGITGAAGGASIALVIMAFASLPLAARSIAPLVVDLLVSTLPSVFLALVHRKWNGAYRAFDGWQVWVVDGDGDLCSFVVADDVLVMLGEKISATDRRRIKLAGPDGFVICDDPMAQGEWVFSDEACLSYVARISQSRHHQHADLARRFALWLQRDVFQPIDNRRSRDTGKPYPFTSDAQVKLNANPAPKAFRAVIKPVAGR